MLGFYFVFLVIKLLFSFLPIVLLPILIHLWLINHLLLKHEHLLRLLWLIHIIHFNRLLTHSVTINLLRIHLLKFFAVMLAAIFKILLLVHHLTPLFIHLYFSLILTLFNFLSIILFIFVRTLRAIT